MKWRQALRSLGLKYSQAKEQLFEGLGIPLNESANQTNNRQWHCECV